MNSRKLLIIGTIIASSVVLAGCSLYKTGTSQDSQDANSQQSTQNTTGSEAQQSIVIVFGGNTVEPTQSSVKTGGTITWKNTGSSKVQVASAPHPQHTDNQEITGDKFVLELAPGEEATVTVVKSGTWGFHDHLNPKVNGKVVVQ